MTSASSAYKYDIIRYHKLLCVQRPRAILLILLHIDVAMLHIDELEVCYSIRRDDSRKMIHVAKSWMKLTPMSHSSTRHVVKQGLSDDHPP